MREEASLSSRPGCSSGEVPPCRSSDTKSIAPVAPAVREFCVAETEAEARADIYDFVVSRFDVIRRVREIGRAHV
mgnify:CR=1 FL=1